MKNLLESRPSSGILWQQVKRRASFQAKATDYVRATVEDSSAYGLRLVLSEVEGMTFVTEVSL